MIMMDMRAMPSNPCYLLSDNVLPGRTCSLDGHGWY